LKLNDETDAEQQYTVRLSDSVYPRILEAFGDAKVNNKNILDDDAADH
jgi:hypothetical protein